MVENKMPVCEYVTIDNNVKIKTLALAFLVNETKEAYFFVIKAWLACGFHLPKVVIID